jgi:ubiquinone/menaquinone biosynthesis C-methylase UbiE
MAQQVYEPDAFEFRGDEPRPPGFTRRLGAWRERRVVAAALRGLGPITTVLDIPCGTARLLPVLARFGLRAVVADPSKEMVKQARGLQKSFVYPLYGFVAIATQIPLPDESVDAVLCSRVLNRLAFPEYRITLLCELARVCRVGVVVSFYDADSFRHRRRLRRNLGTKPGRHAITRQQFNDEVSQAGFKCVSMYALLRYHAELTAAGLVKQGSTS